MKIEICCAILRWAVSRTKCNTLIRYCYVHATTSSRQKNAPASCKGPHRNAASVRLPACYGAHPAPSAVNCFATPPAPTATMQPQLDALPGNEHSCRDARCQIGFGTGGADTNAEPDTGTRLTSDIGRMTKGTHCTKVQTALITTSACFCHVGGGKRARQNAICIINAFVSNILIYIPKNYRNYTFLGAECQTTEPETEKWPVCDP